MLQNILPCRAFPPSIFERNCRLWRREGNAQEIRFSLASNPRLLCYEIDERRHRKGNAGEIKLPVITRTQRKRTRKRAREKERVLCVSDFLLEIPLTCNRATVYFSRRSLRYAAANSWQFRVPRTRTSFCTILNIFRYFSPPLVTKMKD